MTNPLNKTNKNKRKGDRALNPASNMRRYVLCLCALESNARYMLRRRGNHWLVMPSQCKGKRNTEIERNSLDNPTKKKSEPDR